MEPPAPLLNMARRAFRASFYPAIAIAILGAALIVFAFVLSLAEDFDPRNWGIAGGGAALDFAGAVGATLSAARWRPTGSRIRALIGGADRVVWAYGRHETTVARSAGAEAGRREELGVVVHFDDGRRIDLPDDGGDGDDLLTWIRVHCSNAEVGYSPARARQLGVMKP